MAYTVTEIDKYLKGNKFDFYKLITEGWGPKDKDVIEIKRLWQEAEDATGTNSQIEKFKKLQDKLNPFFDRAKERLEKDEKTLIENNASEFPDAEDQANHLFDQSLMKYSKWPEADKNQNLNLDQVYGDDKGGKPYDYEQMKSLAAEYGYDYADKDDRKEFLDKVGEYTRSRLVDEAFDDNTVAGAVTNFVLPTTVEYAKKNYDKDNLSLGAPLAVDAVTNALMTGPLGIAGKTGKAAMGIDALSAPAARAAGRYFINDVNPMVAAKDAAIETALNVGGPYWLRRKRMMAQRPMAGLPEKENLQRHANAMANKVRETERRLKKGTPIVMLEPDANGVNHLQIYKNVKQKDGTYKLVSMNDEGTLQKVTIDGETYNVSDKYKDIIEKGDWVSAKDIMDHDIMKGFVRGKDRKNLNYDPQFNWKKSGTKINTRLVQGQPLYTDMTPQEAQIFTNSQKPFKETRSNKLMDVFANSVLGSENMNPVWNYGTNVATRNMNKQGTNFIGAGLGGYGVNLPTDFFDENKISNTDRKEIEMYRNLKKLHERYPNFVNAPKMPEKFKKYEKDPLIKEIFGE